MTRTTWFYGPNTLSAQRHPCWLLR